MRGLVGGVTAPKAPKDSGTSARSLGDGIPSDAKPSPSIKDWGTPMLMNLLIAHDMHPAQIYKLVVRLKDHR